MSIPIGGYIKRLIKYSHEYQYTKINSDEVNMPKYIFGIYKWVFIGIGMYFLIFSKNIKPDILNSLITSFSILIGLLANLLMTIYNMLPKLTEAPTYTNTELELFKKDARFFKQIGYLTTYAILLGIICIILSILNQCPDSEVLPLIELFKSNWSFNIDDIQATIGIVMYGVIKALLVYFILDLLYIVLFSVSSFIDYMHGEIKDIEKEKE